MRWSGHLLQKLLLFSLLGKTRQKSMARGNGLESRDERLVVSPQMPSPCKRTGRCVAQPRQASTSGEVRQENAFTRACRLSRLPDRLSQMCSPRAVSRPRGQRQSCLSRKSGPSSLACACRCGAKACQARTDAVGGCGRSSASPHLEYPTFAGHTSRCFRLARSSKELLLHRVLLVRCVPIIAGVGRIGSHAMPGRDLHNGTSSSLVFLLFSLSTNRRRHRQTRRRFQ